MTPHHFLFSPSRGPASVLKHRFERSPKKKGKEFVKFVDGLANVAGKYAPTPTTTELVAPALVDPYDLLAKVLAVQHRSVVNRPGRVVEEDVGSANDRRNALSACCGEQK